MSKQGFTIMNIPGHSEQVCNGCEFLKTAPGVRGHKHVTNHFSCGHPDIKQDAFAHSVMIRAGKVIHYDHEGYCQTPDWCPFKNSKKEPRPLFDKDKIEGRIEQLKYAEKNAIEFALWIEDNGWIYEPFPRVGNEYRMWVIYKGFSSDGIEKSATSPELYRMFIESKNPQTTP